MTRFTAAIALAGLFAAVPFHTADAAKAHFERTKPHVSVGSVPSGNRASPNGMIWSGSPSNGIHNGMPNATYNGMPNGIPSAARPRR
jgi:hypothetical protein